VALRFSALTGCAVRVAAALLLLSSGRTKQLEVQLRQHQQS
jgi:hypothetical protein